ncbi:rhomboid family intramembrane serine protease [Geoalkalibacter halelectricus]|uniref:rhomboid family intramembrane serine protease n=1 Tax=Geoalkalibacter halelectricus TaxID=2847045 RepID=UPI003D1DCBC4
MGEGSGRSAQSASPRCSSKTESTFTFQVEAPVSSLLFIASSVLSLTLIFAPRNSTIGVLTVFGWGDGQLFWQGELWRLWINSLLHNNIFHYLFNIYWVLRFSPVLEALIGSRRYLVLLVTAAWVVGLAGNLTWEAGGIGLSGLVYFMFAYLDRLRPEHKAARRVCDGPTRVLFYSWLAIGPLITLAGLVAIGNVVHLAGLVFGLAAATTFRHTRSWGPPRRLVPAAALLTVLLAGSAYLHRPTLNSDWHYWKAYASTDLMVQLHHYQRVLELAPDNNAARYNLGLLHYEQGDFSGAEQYWLQIASREPANAEICRALFSLYARKGDADNMEFWARRFEHTKQAL